jgi:hypothetical protein
MSKVAIQGDPSGSGTFTIAAPNSNNNRTLNLPDNAGTILTSASALAAANLSGRVPAANAPLGSVIQVVRNGAIPNPQITVSSSSFVDMGTTVTITPSSTSSRIMLLFRSPRQSYSGGANAAFRFYRGTTGIGGNPQTQNDLLGERYGYTMSMFFVDSPNTTSSTTYSVYGRVVSGTNFAWTGECAWEFIAMEIAG